MADVIAAWNARAAVAEEDRECVWGVGLRKGDDGTQYFTECGEVFLLESLCPHCPNCGGRVVTTCHMVKVSLYDEEGIEGIECDECEWCDMYDWNDPMPDRCPGCKSKVVAE